MKKSISLLALSLLFVGCSNNSVKPVTLDMMTQPSGKFFYEKTSLLTPEQYVPFINDRLGAVIATTVNKDQSPNVAVVRPGVTEDGKYLTFGLAENRTKENIINQGHVIFTNYQYDKTGGENGKSLNVGFRMIAKYVGDEENKRLNEEKGTKPEETFYCEIIEVLPLG